MPQIKPLKINTDTGDIERMTNSDELPIQEDVDETKNLLAILVAELINIGLPIQSEKLIQLLENL